jgi:ABC-2 type transport system ATP-binding protein
MHNSVEATPPGLLVVPVPGEPQGRTDTQRDLQFNEQFREAAVSIEHVSKVYPDGTVAIDDISFTVQKGQIFGLLGPNGAGKSTLMRIVCGLAQPSSGRTLIAGIDPSKSARMLKEKLCGLLQGSPVEPNMRVREVLELFSKFYRNPSDTDQLLELVGLSDKAGSFLRTLSGGQKQRLAIARALVGNPDILVLDEPTTGLDVAIRNELLTMVLRLRDAGHTIIFSTHYIDEAEKFFDRVAILCKGKVFAVDTPQALAHKYGAADRLEVTLTKRLPLEKFMSAPGISGVQEIGGPDNAPKYTLSGIRAEYMLQQVALALVDTDSRLQEALVIRSGLEGAYLQLTGERIS